jgi:hypothetical protein
MLSQIKLYPDRYSSDIPKEDATHVPWDRNSEAPEFDFQTERIIKVYPYSMTRGVRDHFRTVSIDNRPKTYKRYSVDENGEYIKDGAGRLQTTDDGTDDEAIGMTKTDLSWGILPGETLTLRVPQDNALLRQMMEDPHNASMTHIRGVSTATFSNQFFLVDEKASKEAKESTLKMRRKAEEHARGLSESQVPFIYTYIIGGDETDEMTQRFEIEDYARSNVEQYLDRTIENPNFEHDVLFESALKRRVIVHNRDGYAYVPGGGSKNIVLSTSRPAAISRMLEQDSILSEIKNRTDFHMFYADELTEESQSVEGSDEVAEEDSSESPEVKEKNINWKDPETGKSAIYAITIEGDKLKDVYKDDKRVKGNTKEFKNLQAHLTEKGLIK